MAEHQILECDQCGKREELVPRDPVFRTLEVAAVSWLRVSSLGLDGTVIGETVVVGVYCTQICLFDKILLGRGSPKMETKTTRSPGVS